MRGGGACDQSEGGDDAKMGVAALAGLFIMLIAGMIAICEFVWRRRKLAVDENASVMAEMWEEFKFAINPFAGDAKPNPNCSDSQSASRSSSKAMLSKSTAESLNKYGQIGSDVDLSCAKVRSRNDSTYERFNGQPSP